MIGLMLRGFFLIGIISWYSHGVFKLINDYFRSEYKSYLTEEIKKNKFLMPNDEIAKDNRVEIKDQQPQFNSLPKTVTIISDTVETKESLADVVECSELSCIDNNRQELNTNDNENEKTRNKQDISSSSSSDESAMVNYWLNRKRSNYDGEKDDTHCHIEKCKDN